MFDQLHQFADEAAAQAAFPGEGASWFVYGVTVMSATIWLHDPSGDHLDEAGQPVRGRIAAGGCWLGLATDDEARAAELQALPSCRIAYLRPHEPTPWREAVIWSAMPLAAMTVLEAGSFAGSGYLFD